MNWARTRLTRIIGWNYQETIGWIEPEQDPKILHQKNVFAGDVEDEMFEKGIGVTWSERDWGDKATFAE